MAASKLSSLAAIAAAATSYSLSSSSSSNRAYADGPFRFNPFSSPPPPPPEASDSEPKSEVEVSKGGFDAESLERGAKALREINSSPYKKQVNLLFLKIRLFSVIKLKCTCVCVCN